MIVQPQEIIYMLKKSKFTKNEVNVSKWLINYSKEVKKLLIITKIALKPALLMYKNFLLW